MFVKRPQRIYPFEADWTRLNCQFQANQTRSGRRTGQVQNDELCGVATSNSTTVVIPVDHSTCKAGELRRV
jgi:hypothetical protein